MARYDKLCRLCAADDMYCVQVFSEEGDKNLLRHKMRVCSPVTIRQVDKLPKQICLTCMSNLDQCYEFYQKCKSAQFELKQLFEESGFDDASKRLSSLKRTMPQIEPTGSSKITALETKVMSETPSPLLRNHLHETSPSPPLFAYVSQFDNDKDDPCAETKKMTSVAGETTKGTSVTDGANFGKNNCFEGDKSKPSADAPVYPETNTNHGILESVLLKSGNEPESLPQNNYSQNVKQYGNKHKTNPEFRKDAPAFKPVLHTPTIFKGNRKAMPNAIPIPSRPVASGRASKKAVNHINQHSAVKGMVISPNSSEKNILETYVEETASSRTSVYKSSCIENVPKKIYSKETPPQVTSPVNNSSKDNPVKDKPPKENTQEDNLAKHKLPKNDTFKNSSQTENTTNPSKDTPTKDSCARTAGFVPSIPSHRPGVIKTSPDSKSRFFFSHSLRTSVDTASGSSAEIPRMLKTEASGGSSAEPLKTEPSTPLKGNEALAPVNKSDGYVYNICKYCEKEVREDYMIQHERLHTGETGNSCLVCDRNFLTSLAFDRHKCIPKS